MLTLMLPLAALDVPLPALFAATAAVGAFAVLRIVAAEAASMRGRLEHEHQIRLNAALLRLRRQGKI